MPPHRIASWLLKLLGIPSLTVALMNVVARLYRLHCRRSLPQLDSTKKKDDLQIRALKRTMTSVGDLRLLQTCDRPKPRPLSLPPLSPNSRNPPFSYARWGSLAFASGFLRFQKRVTISLKNVSRESQ